MEELDALVQEVLAANPKLETVFASPLIRHEEKTALLDRVFQPRHVTVAAEFPQGRVAARPAGLPARDPARRPARFTKRSLGNVRVRITTAAAVAPEQVEQIAAALAASLGQRPILETVVDPALIGGAVLRIGDTVYDGSVANQLQQIRQQMIDRSVHEIQSRRDSFRYPDMKSNSSSPASTSARSAA